MSNEKSRAFAMVLYPEEDASHFSALLKIKQIYDYAFILHNLDKPEKENEEKEYKKEHIHVVIKFENARHKSKIAKELEIEENYIQKANFVAYTRYLIHKDDPLKYQYPEKEIMTNIPDQVHSAITLKGDYKRHKSNLVLEYIEQNRFVNFYKLVMWAKDNGHLEEVINNAYFYRNLLKG